MRTEKFWMVYVEGASMPVVKHPTRIEADKEAERLAYILGKTTFVLAAEAMSKPVGIITTVLY